MTKNDKERALIPKLRFPEFQGEPAWTHMRLDRLSKRVTQKNTDERITRVLTNSAERGLLNQREYFDKDIATKGSLNRYYIVENGDFVYNPRISAAAPVGPLSRSNIDLGVISPLYTVFRFEQAETDFYEHYFKSTAWHSYLRNVSSTGARHDRMSVANADFMRMPVPTPHENEQQKIADCLGALDDLIAAERRKLAALRDHKQGLMQQLFPREGETRPRLRFPEFQGAGDWEVCAVGNIAKIFKGKGVAKADIVAGGLTPCIRYAELYTTYGEVITDIKSYTDVSVSALVLSETEDVIIPASGETKADIATCACVASAGVALGSDLNVLRSKVDGRFLSYYLNGVKRPELAKVAQGDTVAHLYQAQISQLTVAIPTDAKEQRVIADCLSTIDGQISVKVAKLNALRTHKHGLMQQLFPASDSAV